MTKIRDKDRWGYKYTEAMFEYLKPFAIRCETVFYGEVAEDVGGSPRSMGGRELTAIQLECSIREWPQLNVLVVTKKNGLPGCAYQPFGHSVTKSEFEKIKQKVCNFDWSDKHL